MNDAGRHERSYLLTSEPDAGKFINVGGGEERYAGGNGNVEHIADRCCCGTGLGGENCSL